MADSSRKQRISRGTGSEPTRVTNSVEFEVASANSAGDSTFFVQSAPTRRSARSNGQATPIADKYSSMAEGLQLHSSSWTSTREEHDEANFEFERGEDDWPAVRDNSHDTHNLAYDTTRLNARKAISQGYFDNVDEYDQPEEIYDSRGMNDVELSTEFEGYETHTPVTTDHEDVDDELQDEKVRELQEEENPEAEVIDMKDDKIDKKKKRISFHWHGSRPASMLENMTRAIEIPLNTIRRGGGSASADAVSLKEDPVMMPVTVQYREDDDDESNNNGKNELPEPRQNDHEERQTKKREWAISVIVVLSVLLALSIAATTYLLATINGQHAMQSSPMQPYQRQKMESPITREDPEVQALLNNPQLRRAFYGMNYSPQGAQYPECGVTLREVTLDLAVLSQVTKRIRLYSTDCMQAEYVIQAIENLGLDMTISLGLWVGASLDVTLRQLSDMRYIIEHYPHQHIDAILVGNEALFRNELTAGDLAAYIEYVRDYLFSRGIRNIKLGTSEIGSKWTADLTQHVDMLAANIHPFFGGVRVNESTTWTYDFLLNQVAYETPMDPSVTYIISEVGWPSAGGSIQGAQAGMDQLQEFIDSWVCQNQDSAIGWYWFEAFDQPWKSIFDTETQKWETHWGLFTEDRMLKDIVIPSCQSN